jgi:bifunctional non-homologous end joining protein LigD
MTLQAYHAKRKFAATPEPRGRPARRKGKDRSKSFVIQKHDASRLHYDLRLELDGVMKSWAVTRGPSLVPGEKRLAVRVEDHPIEYNTFEGTIPQGQYGGGTVLIWDRGAWAPEGDPARGLAKGRLDFMLDGEKLHGAWHLVRMRGRSGEKRENWLLIKGRDDAARGARDPDILEAEPDSVASGRSLDEIAGAKRGRVWQSNRGPAGKETQAGAKAKVKTKTRTMKAKTAKQPSTRKTAAKSAARAERGATKRSQPAKRARPAKPSTATKPSTARKSSTGGKPPAKAGEGGVRLTHPDRVYWVDVGVTKQDLADYYRAVWDWMAPQVVGRPLALVRCPEGTKGQCFFQKHASAGLAEQYLHTETDVNKRQILAVDDLEGLLSLVQAGVLEVHVRGSMIERLDRCDRIIFDLDPGDGLGWPDIVAAARDVHDRLAAIELDSFVKLSGGKGIHVVLPIEGSDWETAKNFAQAFALAMAANDPDRYIAKMAKVARKGKVFIDYLRNSVEQTSVAAYSTRARAGAPVSVPLSWPELARATAANQYTVLNVMKRLGSLKQDPWQDIGRVRQKLPDLGTLRTRG